MLEPQWPLPAGILLPHAENVGLRAVREEQAKRRHVVIGLVGAHAYGFASPDSDLDLKAIHVESTGVLLGLKTPAVTFDRLEVIDGVEIDYTSNELGPALVAILKGNGNFLERVLGPWNVLETPLLSELRDLAARSVSRQIVRHYRGFAQGQLREFEKSQTAKKALYVLRTALTGAVALRSGRIDPDVNHHLGEFGFEDAQELLHIKQTGERAPLPAPIAERWRLRLQDALQVLEDAAAASPLPEEAPTWAEADDWLRRSRLRMIE